MRDFGVRQVEYASVKVRFCARTALAVKVDTEKLNAPQWIPRSCCCFTAHRIINNAKDGDTIEIRIDERTAREKGLLQ